MVVIVMITVFLVSILLLDECILQQPMANQSPLVCLCQLHVIFPPKVIRLVMCMLDHSPYGLGIAYPFNALCT